MITEKEDLTLSSMFSSRKNKELKLKEDYLYYLEHNDHKNQTSSNIRRLFPKADKIKCIFSSNFNIRVRNKIFINDVYNVKCSETFTTLFNILKRYIKGAGWYVEDAYYEELYGKGKCLRCGKYVSDFFLHNNLCSVCDNILTE